MTDGKPEAPQVVPEDTSTVRVGFRLPRKAWEAMRLAAEPIGIESTGGVVKWFALLGLQAAQASSASVRSAKDTAALRSMFEALMDAERQKDGGPDGGAS